MKAKEQNMQTYAVKRNLTRVWIEDRITFMQFLRHLNYFETSQENLAFICFILILFSWTICSSLAKELSSRGYVFSAFFLKAIVMRLGISKSGKNS